MARAVRLVIILVVLAVVVAGAMQRLGRRPAVQENGAPARPRLAPVVRTAPVQRSRLVEQADLPGEVRASATAEVTSRIGGRVGRVLVREGSFVAAGGLVARIDDPELELAVRQADAAVEVQRARLAQLRAGPRAPEVAQVEAQIAQAEAALAQAEREYARAQQLFQDGLIARAVVDRAQTDVEVARQRVRQTREQLAVVRFGPRPEDVQAQLAQVRQAEIQAAQARARLRELRITSPIAGIVTAVNVESGSVISSQTVVATVATISPIELHIPLPETDLPRLQEASLVRARVDALPGRVFEGRVHRIAPALDPASRSATVIVRLPNRDARLRPGMFARATVVFDQRQAILVPSEAIVRRGTAAMVFVVKGTQVEERPVRIGYVEGSRSEIVEGLTVGEQIVTLGQQGLRDGMDVRVAPAGIPGPGGGAPGRTGPTPGGRTRP